MDLQGYQDLQHEDNPVCHSFERRCKAISTKAKKNASFIRAAGQERVKQVSCG